MESSILDGDLRIGDYVVRPLLKAIRPAEGGLGAHERKLPDKAMAVLVYLALNARQVCDRDDILDAVWGEEREAYDRVLDNAIREIRRAFDDSARNPTYIQTIPKRGYRLLKPVESRLLEHATRVRKALELSDSDARQTVRPTREASVANLGRSSTTAKPPAPKPSSSPEPSEATRRSKLRRLGVRIASVLAALLVVSAGFVLWDSSGARVHRVEITEAAGTEAAMAGIASAARQAIFYDHPCGPQSLLAPTGRLVGSDLTLEFSTQSTDPLSLAATLTTSDGERQVILSEIQLEGSAESLGSARFLLGVATELDARVCALDDLPNVAQACHCLASTRTYHALGDPSRHVAHLRRAIALDPELTAAYETLALIYESHGTTDRLREVLTSGLDQIDDPSSGPALILRRRLASSLHDFVTEGELIAQLQQMYPDDARWVLAQAAYLARHRQDCEQTLALLEPLFEIHPELEEFPLETSSSVWVCQLRAGGFPNDRWFVHSPRDSGRRFQLALGSMLSGRLDLARELANEVLALQPDAADSHWLLGTISWRTGAYAAADRWFQQMRRHIRWPNEELRYHEGISQVTLRKGGSGQECAERLEGVEVDGGEWNVIARWLRGLCWVEADQQEQARQVLTQLRTSQDGKSSLWQEWLLLHLEGRIQAANANGDAHALRRAADLFVRAAEFQPPDFAFFATEAGVALEQAGDEQRAQELYEESLAFNPTHPWAHCHLGLLHLRQENVADALEHFRRSLEVFGHPPEDPIGRRCAEELARLQSNSLGTG